MSRSRPPQRLQHNTSTSKARAMSWAHVQFRRGGRLSAPPSQGSGAGQASAVTVGGGSSTGAAPYATTAPRCRAMRGQIEASQLTRRAFVYVRQSTMAQVVHHQESTMMQYELRQRALALGWAPEAIEVIDEDQARSATTTDGRSGFGYVARAVAHGEAGGVFAFDVSRMARASEDWRRLLVLCGVAGVAVVDEQRIYDPADHDDKLLLELKGAMSEAEIHWLRLRLQGARQHKARRGALKLPAPTGYLWGERGFELDPDEAVQRAVRVIFQRYDIEPSGWAVVRWARQTGFKVPTRRSAADGDSGVEWKALRVSRLHEILKNPVYAGVYAYGRRREKAVLVDGQIRRARPDTRDPERWVVKIADAHPGYITWERYVQNQDKLRQNMTRMGNPSRGAPREGPALLSGLLICGRCGHRMGPRYARGARARFWTYACHGIATRASRGAGWWPGRGSTRRWSSCFWRRWCRASWSWRWITRWRATQRSWRGSGGPGGSRRHTRRGAPRSATRPWTPTTAWWRERSNASGRASSRSWRRWSASTPRPAGG